MDKEFSEFREPEKSLKDELGVNLEILLSLSLWHCASISVSHTRGCGFKTKSTLLIEIEFPRMLDSTMYRGLTKFSEFTEMINENRKYMITFPHTPVLVVNIRSN